MTSFSNFAIQAVQAAYCAGISSAGEGFGEVYPKLIHYNKVDKGGHFAAW
jgi:hypothetical protein